MRSCPPQAKWCVPGPLRKETCSCNAAAGKVQVINQQTGIQANTWNRNPWGDRAESSPLLCFHRGMWREKLSRQSHKLSHTFPGVRDSPLRWEKMGATAHVEHVPESHISVCTPLSAGSLWVEGIMVWVVSEHSSCAVTGMFLTAFRQLALMMFCVTYGQLGVFFSIKSVRWKWLRKKFTKNRCYQPVLLKL